MADVRSPKLQMPWGKHLSKKSRAPETRVPSAVQYPALSRLSAAGFQHAPMWSLGTGLLPGKGGVEDRYWQMV